MRAHPLRLVLVALAFATLAGCAAFWSVTKRAPVATVLLQPSSMQALFLQCVMDGMAQGLTTQMATERCSMRVGLDHFGEMRDPITASLPVDAGDFNPAAVQAACGAGVDPRVGKDFTGLSADALNKLLDEAKDRRAAAQAAGNKKTEAFWDGVANAAAEALERLPPAPPTPPAPPPPPKPKSRTAGESVCASVVQHAREILAECTRSGWKRGGCAVLGARLNHCPNPTYAYIDPDGQGLACAQAPDPKAVAEAYQALCQRNTDGGTACGPLVAPEGDLPLYRARDGNVCTNPKAHVSPDSDACVLPLQVRNPGGVNPNDLQTVILIASTKLGGPVFVLPSTGPGPLPPGGGDPVPEPRR